MCINISVFVLFLFDPKFNNRSIGLVGHRIKQLAETAQTTPKIKLFDPVLPLRVPRKAPQVEI